jgi:hypothetical protein
VNAGVRDCFYFQTPQQRSIIVVCASLSTDKKQIFKLQHRLSVFGAQTRPDLPRGWDPGGKLEMVSFAKRKPIRLGRTGQFFETSIEICDTDLYKWKTNKTFRSDKRKTKTDRIRSGLTLA